MLRLISVLEGEAKKFIAAIGSNGISYATALKTLKKKFGDPFVADLKTKAVFNRPQRKTNDRMGLRNFHNHLKICNSWLCQLATRHPYLQAKLSLKH